MRPALRTLSYYLLIIVLTSLLFFAWLNSMRPAVGKPRTTEQQGVCVLWEKVGRPCGQGQEK